MTNARETLRKRAAEIEAREKAGEPPPPAAPPGDPWAGDPIPLSAAAAAPPPFPLHVFPDWLAAFLAGVARAVHAPVDYAATFALGVAAGAVGATLRVQVAPKWYERACLYCCVVAPKSAGKTPCFLAVFDPMRAAQAKRMHDHADLEEIAPVVYTTDTTVEAIAPRLRDNPRGMVVATDELSGWVGSFNAYKNGRGSDRQFWLSNWSGGDYSILRRNPEAPHIYVPHPCVSVVGGVQPAVLAELAAGRDDGLLERLLLSCPPTCGPAPASREGYPNEAEWGECVRLLLGRAMDEGEYGPRPHLVRLDDAAWGVFRDWTADCQVEERLAGARSKLNAYAARFALVLHALRYLPGAGQVVPATIAADTMQAGVDLARYFLAHAAHVYGSHRESPAVRDAERLLDWLRAEKPAAFSRRDAYRKLHRSFPNSQAIAEPLRLLVDHGWLRVVPAGRQDRWAYEAHPSVTAVTHVSPASGDT